MTMPLAFVVTPSQPFPLGLTPARSAEQQASHTVNLAVYAPGLDAVDVHFVDQTGAWRKDPLPEYTNGVHHGLVTGMPEGTHYAFAARLGADGVPPEPGRGSLLLDPYGRAVDRVGTRWLNVRVHQDFDWGTVGRPAVPMRDTIVYEAHVKGQSMLNPEVPAELRGTYAGLAHPAMIEHFHRLGVTSIQLLPVHFHLDESHLQDVGLTNYWGYNTAAFFAPHPAYATKAARAAGPQAVQDEFKGMVKLLHMAGLEVFLDVVYNHSAEEGAGGPTISFRGLGDREYYRSDPEGRYIDTTGCGNTIDFSNPRVVQLALDSLRLWAEEYRIDGFRFDLAVSLCRDGQHSFTPAHPFLVAAAADPVISQTKLIAEPWDLGFGGWQTGRFPLGWADWNDHYRDTVRDFWLVDRAELDSGGLGGPTARLADAVSGSHGLFAASGRTALASVNFFAAHDGFTLADLTSYHRKHNEANGEQNRDGATHNRSYNHGIEGPTEVDSIIAARLQTAKNLMATLMVSLGVPMITAGDEFGRSQQGNNNAYCQDNEVTWLNWNLDLTRQAMLEHTAWLIRIRKDFLARQPTSYPEREESNYFHWFGADGTPMDPDRWQDPRERLLQFLLGSKAGYLDGLVVINGGPEKLDVTFPEAKGRGMEFELRYSTATQTEHRIGTVFASGEAEVAEPYSVSIYRARNVR
ncbi:glycogen debranching protein GlgX [Sinomonas notoginsengisoli]|uniref:glycogen debranching protein GlgX n=1 Tax=Sinomonas notoginsengisoli TaxID=1457311 RepID=UPI001F456B25|nr:glycogen debranching protein GlgX [Sinomonas notoginsengisoli]